MNVNRLGARPGRRFEPLCRNYLVVMGFQPPLSLGSAVLLGGGDLPNLKGIRNSKVEELMMKLSNSSEGLTAWLRRPLCRRYVVVVPRTTPVAVRCPSGTRLRSVYWLFGHLADGESEPLGAWLRADSSGLQPKLHTELRDRGLERIRYLYVGDLREDRCGLPAGYPGARLLGVNWQVVEGDEHLVPAVRSAAQTAHDIEAALARSIRRHGSFENPAAALDFVTAALQRAEHRMDRERAIAKVRPRLDSGAQMAGSAV